MRITKIDVVPVAFADPPLLNIVGAHQPKALRSIIIVHTNDGLYGLGESYGDSKHVARLKQVSDRLIGMSPFSTEKILLTIAEMMKAEEAKDSDLVGGMVTGVSLAHRVFAPFEVALLDLQGKAFDLPVSALLGGKVRNEVEFSGYLFYKWARHPGAEPDQWGSALAPDELVNQARQMIDEYGFQSLKLKGGVFPPDEEAEAMEALKAAFPQTPLRLDPNGAWSPKTSIRVARRLEGVLEYLEDPTPGRAGMAAVKAQLNMPLATNMCVVSFGDIPEAVQLGSVDIVLSDHHFWGGLRASKTLAQHCATFGLGLSMHSNSHLGISMAAMINLAASTPNLEFASDTHWPWLSKEEDVIVEKFTFEQGKVKVSDAPGLGVSLNFDKLEKQHQEYLSSGIRDRDDTGYMRQFVPDFDPATPRW